jgi:hypothetical protein
VPMRVLYWGRWADSSGGVGPFSATCAAWIEGGTHNNLPGGLAMYVGQFGRPQQQLIDATAALPAGRDERYSVALLEVHVQSFHAHPAPAAAMLPAPATERDEPRQPRQLQGPASEEAA